MTDHLDTENLGKTGSAEDDRTADSANDTSQVSHVSQLSNDVASSRDATGTPASATCPIGHEVDPSEGEPEKVKEPRRPTFECYLTHTQYGPPGLYFHGQRQKGDKLPEPYDERVCSPIQCLAATHDERGDNHGLLLRFKPFHGAWWKWAMPLRLLKGSGEEMRGELLDMGVRIEPGAFKLLNQWAARQAPDERVIAATRVGWHQLEEGLAFVMPRRTIAKGELAHRITFQSEVAGQDDYATSGTLESWRTHIGQLCSGNPLMVLVVHCPGRPASVSMPPTNRWYPSGGR